jgi:protein-disulfide isomerase
MNKRVVLAGLGIGALAAFGGGAWWLTRSKTQQQTAAIQGNAASLRRAGAVPIGSPNAKVTIVEFFDPVCGACAAYYPYVKQTLERHAGRVNLELRYAPMHEGADRACLMIEAARKQDKFTLALETALAQQDAWARPEPANLDKLGDAFKAAGIDLAQLQSAMQLPEIQRVVETDMAAVQALKITGTPKFFINALPFEGVGPDPLNAWVDAQVKLAYPG